MPSSQSGCLCQGETTGHFDHQHLAPAQVDSSVSLQAQTKSLEQDSGYLGSPATEHLHLASLATGVTSPPLGEAKRELASLLRDQEESRSRGRDEGESGKGSREEREKEDFLRSNSLPSFPESFQVPSLLSHTSKGNNIPSTERCPPQEELDDLDLEIEAIVGLRDGGSSGKMLPSSTPASQTVQLTPDCLKPRPLRTSAVMISPGGPVMLSPMLAGGGGGGSTPLVMVNTVSTAVTSESVSQGGVSQGGLNQQGLGLELGPEGGAGTAVLGTVELLPVQSSSWSHPPPGYKKASQFTGKSRMLLTRV